MWVQLFQRMEYQGNRTQTITLFGADDHYMDIQGGTLLRGRFFTRGELTGEEVMVIETEVADRLFGELDPIGRYVRVGPTALRVIGVYQKPDNIFEPPGQQIGGVLPFETARQNYHYDETNNLFIAVRPRLSQDPGTVRDLATVALRRVRNLRPGMPNTFDLITQDQILDVVGKFTTYFFLAMVSLSSVALLVGGIGVMAIMMISVTERTREIGVRKALGARRQEVLFQFLSEAAVLTSIGGVLGILCGSGIGLSVTLATGFPISLPWWSFAIGLGFSAGVGIFFGMVPAVRASRLDPIEALRHE
jgi:putative ABC transport system permease protein